MKFGVAVVVAVNVFNTDTEMELQTIVNLAKVIVSVADPVPFYPDSYPQIRP